jgi:1-deoxy-D-xylulose-5-phosphate synthase
MLEFALSLERPAVIRYPKSVCSGGSLPVSRLQLGQAELLKEGRDFTLIALGSMVEPASQALELLSRQGLYGSLVNARFVKPLDRALFKKLAAKSGFVFSVEDGVSEAGFGSAVSEAIDRQVVRMGLPDRFIPHARREELLEKYGLTAQGIAGKIKEALAG